MPLRTRYIYEPGALARALAGYDEPIEIAATKAIKSLAEEWKLLSRANIAAAGFSRRWQNTLRVNAYPRGGKSSINAAAYLYHKIPYAGVFETGATIRGRPLLWVPLSTAPQKIGRERITPQKFVASIGPLTYVARPGRNPLLVAKKSARSRSRQGRTSLSSLRRGAASSGGTVSVPVFVGLSVVQIGQKFSIGTITRLVSRRLPGRYSALLRV